MEGEKEKRRERLRFLQKNKLSFLFFFWEVKTHTKCFPSLCFLHLFFFFLPSPPPLLPLLLGFLLPLCQNDFLFSFLLIFVCSSFKVNLKVHLQELARRLASGAGGGGSASVTRKKKTTTTTREKQEKFSPFFAGQKPSAASVPLRNKTTSKQF